MSRYHDLRAGSQTLFDELMDVNMGFYSSAGPNLHGQELHNPQDHPAMYHPPTGKLNSDVT